MFEGSAEKRSSVVRALADSLRQDIVLGHLAPDTKLKIEDLRQVYGGSANSLREALTSLANEGLVEAISQKGFRVASMTPEDLEDINRLRQEIECLGLAWSIQNGDVDWEGDVLAAYHKVTAAEQRIDLGDAASLIRWDDAHKAFHLALSAACGSSRLIRFQARLYDERRRFRLMTLVSKAERGEPIGFDDTPNHGDLLQAMLAKDATKATELLRKHIAQGSESVSSVRKGGKEG